MNSSVNLVAGSASTQRFIVGGVNIERQIRELKRRFRTLSLGRPVVSKT